MSERISNVQMQAASEKIGRAKVAMDTSHNLATYTVGLLDAVNVLAHFENDVRTDDQERLAMLPFKLPSKPDVATIVMCRELLDHLAQRYAAAVPVYEQVEATPNGEEEKPQGVTEH